MNSKNSWDHIQKHSRYVALAKRSLPICAFLVIVLIITWPYFNPAKDKFSLAIAPGSKQAQVAMENLRFFGLNDKKLPMTLNAPIVHQEPDKKDQAKMLDPVGTYQMDSKDVMHLSAPYALINQKAEHVFFEDWINIKTDSGYIGKTSQVLCDFNQGTADGNSPISISGPAGKLNAQGVFMSDKGNIILFKKKATALIKNKGETLNLKAQNGIQINQIQKTLTAKENVHATQQGDTLKSDEAVLYYTNDKQNRIQKIVATGHVSLSNQKQTVFGDAGVYNPITQRAEMTGNVIVQQGDHKLFGNRALVNMKTGTSELFGSKRVKGQLVANQLKGESNE